MKLSVPNARIAEVLLALHDDTGPEYMLVQRTGPGWIIEIPPKIDPALKAKIQAMGLEIAPRG